MASTGVKLAAVDLNLLVVFDAVMEEGSVTRAGHRLGLSQSAMSHALARLRHLLKDDLFVRSPSGMVPTPRAEQLAAPVRVALDGLRQSLEPTEFDPSTATRTFRVAVDNYAAIVLVAPLATRVIKIAPRVTLEFRPSGTQNISDLLDRGQLDLAIGPFAEQAERFSRQQLLQDKFVAVLRRNHPAAHLRQLSIESISALSHLEISSVHYATDFVDEALARRNLVRWIALRAPSLSAVQILVSSDMVSIFPQRIAEELIRSRPLVIRPLWQSSPILKIAMIWPRRLANQGAHRWLREIVGAVIEDLRSE